MNARNLKLAALCAAAFPIASLANDYCVDATPGSPCYPTIGSALAVSTDGDTIHVAPGTYAEGNLFVGASVNIVGADAASVIVDASATHPVAVFQYSFWGNATSTLSGMTIRGGQHGVDVARFNTVTLDHVHVTQNGPATGAGIFNNASVLYVKGSLVDYNSATDAGSINGCDWGGASGGGLASLCGGGSNYISDSTFANNVAGRWGGAMIVNDGTTVIENSTIYANQAGDPSALGASGLFVGGAFPSVLVQFSTFLDNLGTNTILADSKTSFLATILDGGTGCAGSPASLGFNVVSDTSCAFTQTADIQGVDPLVQETPVGGLAYTFPIPFNSPAVDRVPPADCTVMDDQLGTPRPQRPSCDSGAYELVFTPVVYSNLLVAEVTGLSLPHGNVQQATNVQRLLQMGQTNGACGMLQGMSVNVNQEAAHRQITPQQAGPVLRTISDLQATVGC
jgi:hypothetical protein